MNQENHKKNFISQLIRMENDFLTGNTQKHNEEISKDTTKEAGQEWFDVLHGNVDGSDI